MAYFQIRFERSLNFAVLARVVDSKDFWFRKDTRWSIHGIFSTQNGFTKNDTPSNTLFPAMATTKLLSWSRSGGKSICAYGWAVTEGFASSACAIDLLLSFFGWHISRCGKMFLKNQGGNIKQTCQNRFRLSDGKWWTLNGVVISEFWFSEISNKILWFRFFDK